MEPQRGRRCVAASSAVLLILASVACFGGQDREVGWRHVPAAVELDTAETDWMVRQVYATFKDSTKPDVQALLTATDNVTEAERLAVCKNLADMEDLMNEIKAEKQIEMLGSMSEMARSRAIEVMEALASSGGNETNSTTANATQAGGEAVNATNATTVHSALLAKFNCPEGAGAEAADDADAQAQGSSGSGAIGSGGTQTAASRASQLSPLQAAALARSAFGRGARGPAEGASGILWPDGHNSPFLGDSIVRAQPFKGVAQRTAASASGGEWPTDAESRGARGAMSQAGSAPRADGSRQASISTALQPSGDRALAAEARTPDRRAATAGGVVGAAAAGLHASQAQQPRGHSSERVAAQGPGVGAAAQSERVADEAGGGLDVAARAAARLRAAAVSRAREVERLRQRAAEAGLVLMRLDPHRHVLSSPKKTAPHAVSSGQGQSRDRGQDAAR